MVVHDGPAHHSGTFTFQAPTAGRWVFEIVAAGTWRLWVGEPPVPVEPNVVIREVEVKGESSIEACDALLANQ